MLSSDSKIFYENSEVRQRMIEYGKLFYELHIIVLNKKLRTIDYKSQIINNLFLYPTNSISKFSMIYDAIKIGKSLKKPDYITTQDSFEIGFAGYMIAKYQKTKLQLQIHTDFLSPYFKKESLKNKIRVYLAKYLLSKADYIRAVSEKIKESLKAKNYKLKAIIRVLPIFVDVKKIRDAEIKMNLHKKYPQFDFIILMASRLTREKNIPLAINAMLEVIKKYPKTGLVIVGEGEENKNLKSISYKLQANIVFEDWTDDITSYYKTADLFLLTSDYEGYGRTIIEALSVGLPVVSTDVGCAGESGAILIEHNQDDLSKKIIEYIENPKKIDFKYPYESKEDYLKLFKNQFL